MCERSAAFSLTLSCNFQRRPSPATISGVLADAHAIPCSGRGNASSCDSSAGALMHSEVFLDEYPQRSSVRIHLSACDSHLVCGTPRDYQVVGNAHKHTGILKCRGYGGALSSGYHGIFKSLAAGGVERRRLEDDPSRQHLRYFGATES